MNNITLKTLIKNQFINFDQKLTSKALESQIISRPWAIVDGEMEVQKLIFEKKGKLWLSKNGIVQEGSWQYLSGTNSLVIDRVSNKLLCNLLYIDANAIILKRDGTEDEFFAFANEKSIPSLNLLQYFNEKLLCEGVTTDFTITQERKLKVHLKSVEDVYLLNKPVTIENYIPDDGMYLEKTAKYLFTIKNGRLNKMILGSPFLLDNNETLLIFENKYAFKKDGAIASGSFTTSDGQIQIYCSKGVVNSFHITYKIGRKKYCQVKQKHYNALSIGDEIVSVNGTNEANFNFKNGLNKIVVESNKVVSIADFTNSKVFVLVIFIIPIIISIVVIVLMLHNA